MSSSCHICGDRSSYKPDYCYSCQTYASNKRGSFVHKLVVAINNYNNHGATIKAWVEENITDKLLDVGKLKKPTLSELKTLACSRKLYRNAVVDITDNSLFEKARVELAIFEVITTIGSQNGVTKDEIDEIIKIPINRYTSINKLMGDKLQKKGNAFLYGNNEIQMLLDGTC